MVALSAVPAYVRSSSDAACCSRPGLSSSCPSTSPTLTAATGPSQGMPAGGGRAAIRRAGLLWGRGPAASGSMLHPTGQHQCTAPQARGAHRQAHPPEHMSAAEAALMAAAAGSSSPPALSTDATSCTSWASPLGSSGRSARSTSRAASTSAGLGAPSRRLALAGMRPEAE
jgi:hypothetical protein